MTGGVDDLYLEGRTSGDLPIDDEDGLDDSSGSGSGDYEIHKTFFDFSQTTTPKSNPNPTTTSEDSQDQTTTPRTRPFISSDGDGDKKVSNTVFDWFTDSPSPSTTRVSHSETTTTESDMDDNATKDTDEDNSVDGFDREVVIEEVSDNELHAKKVGGEISTSTEEVTSENLWGRTEVLAAVIACGVVGFFCAVFLLLLLAYRMKKKDEGSYDLGDTKLSTTAYHKAPTKEFYA